MGIHGEGRGPLASQEGSLCGMGRGVSGECGVLPGNIRGVFLREGAWLGGSGHPLHPVRGLELWVPHRGSVESQRFQLFRWNPHCQHDGDLVLWRCLRSPRKAAQGWGQGSALSLLLRQGKSRWEAGRTPGPLGRRREGEGLATNRHCKLWFKTIT